VDEPLWPEAKRGELNDPERFRAFYALALPRVHSYLYRRCNMDLGLTEDLTQEVFMAVVASIRQGTIVTDPVPWAMGIARHKLLDHFRRKRRAGWTVVSIDNVASDDALTDDELASAASTGGERAMLALASVPSPQREALVLRYLDGLSTPEIASALDRSVSAAESLLVRGRVAFRRNFLEARDGA
jgi:RNA polymerase sigma-70 factor (ECF subfamily)